MRHRCKVHHLSRPADQRKAMLRSMTTSLFMHGEVVVTLARAKALKELADKVVGLAKRGDVHAMRQVSRMIFNQQTGELIADTADGKRRQIPETVLRKIFRTVGPKYTDRKGGYVRVIQVPPRRGDAAPMACVQLIEG
jgi:large subunit ribosomal protein L17